MLAGTVKRYPRYRASCIEWLGEIPAHWQAKRLKFVAPIRSSKMMSAPPDQPFVGLENIEPHTGRLLHDAGLSEPESVVGWFAAGDVLLGKLRPYLAKVARPVFNGISTTELVALQPAACSQDYLFYALLNTSFIRWLDSLTFGSKMPRVSPEQIANTFVPVPPEEEQQVITAFLDREMAGIDALLERKARLVDLLREQRTALISHTVTRGLVANVSMKGTGVEWIGETPAHWEVRRLKSVATVSLSNVDKKSVEGQTKVELCNYVDVYNAETIGADCDFMPATATAEQVCRFSLRKGDVLATKDSETWRDIAVPALVREDLPTVLCGYHLAHIRPISGLCDGAYLSRCLAAARIRDQFQVEANGITRFGLTGASIANAVLPLPPIAEQRSIAVFLDRETAKIDALVAKVQEAIERLKEYRLALISAAVTGNIDVRGEAAQ